MSNKRFLGSNDGATFYDLPIAELNYSETVATADQTHINNSWSDEANTLKSWEASGDCKFQNEKGYNSLLQVATSSTSTTSAPGINTSEKIYQFQDGGGEGYVIDTSTIVVYDNGIEVSAADIQEFQPADGKVVFSDSYSVTGPVTADFNYYSLAEIGYITEMTFDFSKEEKDLTSLKASKDNGGWSVKEGGLKSLSISGTNIKVFGNSVDFSSLIAADNLFFITLDLFDNKDIIIRAAVHISGNSVSTSAGARVEESLTIAPKHQGVLDNPVSVSLDSAALEKGVYTVLNDFFNDAGFHCSLYDEGDASGKEYRSGNGFISDIGLSISPDEITSFSVSVTGSGELLKNNIN